MSLYSQYLKERTNKQILETEQGFVTYQIFGKECYIEDIFVIPSLRKERVATKLADEVSEIAKTQGCTHLTGSVCLTSSNSTQSLKVLLGYGMTLLKSEINMIYFVKEIK